MLALLSDAKGLDVWIVAAMAHPTQWRSKIAGMKGPVANTFELLADSGMHSSLDAGTKQ
jgi:hypothetical protein